ncbi:MAG: spore germination protein [Bacillota bacterium]|jgi:spore germination protein KA
MNRRQTKRPIPVGKLTKRAHAEGEHAQPESNAVTSPLVAAYDRRLSNNLQENLTILKQLFGSDDVVYREFCIGSANGLPAALIFIDELIDKDSIQRDAMTNIMLRAKIALAPGVTTTDGIKRLVADDLLAIAELKEIKSYPDVLEAVLGADAVLLVDGMAIAFAMGVKAWEHRGIGEATNESAIRGPREAFNELLKSSLALIRRRIKDPMLRVKMVQLGKRSLTDAAIVYIEGVANPYLVKEVCRRLDLIKTEAIIDSSYVEQFIQDAPFSPFPQVQWTERPDRTVAGLLAGRVVIICDGSPNAIIAPATLPNFLPATEDYYERWLLSSFVRFVRTFSILASVLLPALYISVINFHQELLPTTLAIAIAGSRTGVPISALLEALTMEFTFELLREAGLRLPAALGSTIGIVGGIIIGQAAVAAGLVSPIMVVIVALTAIGGFAIPSYNVAATLRILRFPLLFLGGTFGLFGVTAGGIVILLHLVSLKSFGVPYLSPVAPLTMSALTDTVVRAPIWAHRLRPLFYRPQDTERSSRRPSYYQRRQELHPDGLEVAPLRTPKKRQGGESDADAEN